MHLYNARNILRHNSMQSVGIEGTKSGRKGLTAPETVSFVTQPIVVLNDHNK